MALMHVITKKLGLSTEFALLMIGLPLLMVAVLPMKYLIALIWAAALYCYVIIRIIRHEGMADDWGRAAVNWANLKPILLRFAFCAALMLGMTWYFKPDLLFNFVLEKPYFWLLVMCAYPLLSVIPQEVIFRQFFFMRYSALFPQPVMIVAMSGLTFAFAHILFQNWVAPTLCFIGGVIFALTYQKTRSLLLVCIEHALYGDFMFTVGLGRYFYHGSVAAAVQ